MGEKHRVLNERQLLKVREQEIQSGLLQFYGRTRWEPSTEETPLHALLDKEASQSGGELDELVEWGVRNQTIRRLFQYLSSDGPSPVDVLRRVYAVGAHMGIPPFCELTLREKALLFGDSHESHRWLMKRLCIDPLRRQGAKSIKAPGQKGRAASLAASVAQRGNSNRKKTHHVNGHAAVGHPHNKRRPQPQ